MVVSEVKVLSADMAGERTLSARKNMRQHRCGRSLSVATCDRQNVRIFLRNASQQFRAAEKTFPRPPRAIEVCGVHIHRLRVDDRIFRDLLFPDCHP